MIVQGLFAVIAAVAAVGLTGSAVTSPDGRRAGPIGDRPLIAMTQPARLVDLGNNGPVDGLAWLDGGRLAVATGLDSILHVLEPSGLRSGRWELDGEALTVVAAGRRAVVLMSPVDRFGPAWLAIDEPGKLPQRVPLPGIRAGRGLPEDRYEPPRTPALIVVVRSRGARRAHRRPGRRGERQGHGPPRTGAARRAAADRVPGRRRAALRDDRARAALPGSAHLAHPEVAPRAAYGEPWRDGVLAVVGRYSVGFDGAGRRIFRRRVAQRRVRRRGARRTAPAARALGS